MKKKKNFALAATLLLSAVMVVVYAVDPPQRPDRCRSHYECPGALLCLKTPMGNLDCVAVPPDYFNICCPMYELIYDSQNGKLTGCIKKGTDRCNQTCYCPITDKDEWNN